MGRPAADSHATAKMERPALNNLPLQTGRMLTMISLCCVFIDNDNVSFIRSFLLSEGTCFVRIFVFAGFQSPGM